MVFKVGQEFKGVYPPECATWCNENGCIIKPKGEGFVIIKPEQSLEDIRKNQIKEINRVYEEKASMVKIDVPESEVNTWYIQEAEAMEWCKDDSVETPFVDSLAEARKIDREDLLKRIENKVTNFKLYMGALTGSRQYYEDQINEASTIEEIEAVIWKE